MDISPGLKDAALRIRDSIDRFAKLKGWSRENYHLVMFANLVWLYFQVNVYAKEYDSPHLRANLNYDEIYDHLENELKDDPALYEAIGILLWPFSCVHGKHPLAENYVQVDDSLLNPGWVYPELMSQATQRDEG